MVYFIKAKKQIRHAINKILDRDREISMNMIIAGLRLETGMTGKFIAEIIKDMQTINKIQIIDGIIMRIKDSQNTENQRFPSVSKKIMGR